MKDKAASILIIEDNPANLSVLFNLLNEAGFEVLGLEGISIPFAEVGRLSSHEVYAFTKKQYLKHPSAQGICMLGSGWRILIQPPTSA